MTALNPALTQTGQSSRTERMRAFGWSGAENVCRQILSLLFFLICVRFLQPEDVGIYALSLACSAIPGVLIDEPSGEALVQQSNSSPAAWNTGFTVNLVLSCALMVLLSLSGGLLGRILGEPRLAGVLPVLGIGTVLGSLGNMQRAYLVRHLKFRAIATTALATQVIGGLTSVALAIGGAGYWALVANFVLVAAANSAAFAWQCRWKPRLHFDRAVFVSRVPYAAYSVTLRIVYLLRDQSPLIIAGLLLDVATVGFFSLALRVARSLGQLFEEVMSRPLLSMLSREQASATQFGAVLTEALTAVAMVAAPAYVGLAAAGPLAIALTFGPRWGSMATMVPSLCAVLAGWLALHIVCVSLRARGLGRIAVWVSTPATLLDVALLACFMPFGLSYALAAWAARSVLWLPVAGLLLHRYLGVNLQSLARRCIPPALASAAMGIVILALQQPALLGVGFTALLVILPVASLLYLVMLTTLMASVLGHKAVTREVLLVLGRVK